MEFYSWYSLYSQTYSLWVWSQLQHLTLNLLCAYPFCLTSLFLKNNKGQVDCSQVQIIAKNPNKHYLLPLFFSLRRNQKLFTNWTCLVRKPGYGFQSPEDTSSTQPMWQCPSNWKIILLLQCPKIYYNQENGKYKHAWKSEISSDEFTSPAAFKLFIWEKTSGSNSPPHLSILPSF